MTTDNQAVLAKVMAFKRACLAHQFPKTGRNNFQGYDYYTESDVFGVINPILADVGLIANYDIFEQGVDTLEKGYRIRAAGTMVLTDFESGQAFTFGPIFADGADTSDKAAYKMNTGLVRTLWCKFIGLSNKDEPENDEPSVGSRKSSSKAVSPATWDKDSLYSKASKAGKLKEAQTLKAEGKTWDEIAKELAL